MPYGHLRAHKVKKTDPRPGTVLWVGIDQSFHALWLLCAALAAA